ncbi:MAG: hypothetical protein ACTHM5_05060 [Ginsengibacter sp.]
MEQTRIFAIQFIDSFPPHAAIAAPANWDANSQNSNFNRNSL